MSSVGFSELLILFVIGLLILGPERLPRVATQIGRWVGRARRTANQLRYQLEREITLADIEAKSKKKKDQNAKPGDSASEAGKSESRESEDTGAEDTRAEADGDADDQPTGEPDDEAK